MKGSSLRDRAMRELDKVEEERRQREELSDRKRDLEYRNYVFKVLGISILPDLLVPDGIYISGRNFIYEGMTFHLNYDYNKNERVVVLRYIDRGRSVVIRSLADLGLALKER